MWLLLERLARHGELTRLVKVLATQADQLGSDTRTDMVKGWWINVTRKCDTVCNNVVPEMGTEVILSSRVKRIESLRQREVGHDGGSYTSEEQSLGEFLKLTEYFQGHHSLSSLDDISEPAVWYYSCPLLALPIVCLFI